MIEAVRLTGEEREWIALTIRDVAAERDADDAARLVEARIETLIGRRITAERQRIRGGLHQMCEESPNGLYGDYGPVMVIGEEVEALVDDRPWEGLGSDEDDCEHDWFSRPESDTYECDICGAER